MVVWFLNIIYCLFILYFDDIVMVILYEIVEYVVIGFCIMFMLFFFVLIFLEEKNIFN